MLLVARTKELYREPEVVFWVFVFPLLLALGLGIAFRNKPAEVSRVVVVAGPDASRAVELLKSSPAGSSVQAEVRPEAEAFNQFRLGKYDLVVTRKSDSSFEYRYDPARTESLLARGAVDDAAGPLSGAALAGYLGRLRCVRDRRSVDVGGAGAA